MAPAVSFFDFLRTKIIYTPFSVNCFSSVLCTCSFLSENSITQLHTSLAANGRMHCRIVVLCLTDLQPECPSSHEYKRKVTDALSVCTAFSQATYSCHVFVDENTCTTMLLVALVEYYLLLVSPLGQILGTRVSIHCRSPLLPSTESNLSPCNFMHTNR